MNASLDALLYMESHTARNGMRRLLQSRNRLILWSVTVIATVAACMLYFIEGQDTQPLLTSWLGPTGIAVLLVVVGSIGMIGFGDQLREEVVASQLLAWGTISERDVSFVVGVRIALQAWSTLLFRAAPFALLLLPKGLLAAVALRWYLFAALAILFASGARLARTLAPRLFSSLVVTVGTAFVVAGFSIVAGLRAVDPPAQFIGDAVTRGELWPFGLVCVGIAGVIVWLAVAPVRQARLGADDRSRAGSSAGGSPKALADFRGPLGELWMIYLESARNGTRKAVLVATAAVSVFGTLGGLAARNFSAGFIALVLLGTAIGIVVFAVAISHAAVGSTRVPLWWCLGATRERIILRLAVRGGAQAIIEVAAPHLHSRSPAPQRDSLRRS